MIESSNFYHFCLILGYTVRALYQPIFGPKFGPWILNAKKYVLFQTKNSQFDQKKFFLFFFGSPSLFYKIQIQNILLHVHIYNFTE